MDIMLPQIRSGWITAGETWTYASADSPSFTFTISGDKRDKYSVGMKIKLTQGSVKYFIITAVSYSGGNTTITVYGGTDYTLTSATITNPFYSTVKAPQGFPMNPEKWRVIRVDVGTDRVTAGAGATVWYNIGGNSLTVPIGLWKLSYSLTAQIDTSASSSTSKFLNVAFGNTASSGLPEWTASFGLVSQYFRTFVQREGQVLLSNKTTYYLNTMSSDGVRDLYNLNGSRALILEAVCAYL